uniref:Beta/gamma crystallin 'Greek key' domain-containing protein n=1 Tax=Terrapene triunguis TaxID=2587831 RepID=A0A674HYU8_9SAUR
MYLSVSLSSSSSATLVSRIIFYEDRDFQGRSYAVTADQPDMHAHLNRCNSIQVESGCWMIYERPHYIGHQYFLKRGEYSNYQQWMGFNDSVKSCCIITPVSSLIRVYERNDVGGRMTESFCDYPSLCDEFHPRDIQSCHVFEGNWIFCGQPNYRARQSLLRPRAYRGVTDWGAGTAWLSCHVITSVSQLSFISNSSNSIRELGRISD